MFRPLSILPAVAVAAGLTLAGAAIAQTQPPIGGPPQDGQIQAGQPGGTGGHMMRDKMRERIHARSQAVHDALNLRPDQEGAWQALVQGMRPQPGAHGLGGHGDHQAMAELTTPQRLDMMAERLAKHQAMFQRRAEAIKHFYASLDPAQQRTFDAVSRLEHGMGGRGMSGHGMHGGGGALPMQGR
jgi:protein CpxP